MCLYTKNKKLKVATKDIVCWKLFKPVRKTDSEGNTTVHIYPPYHDEFGEIEDAILSGEKDYLACPQDYNETLSLSKGIVKRGFIHTFAKKKDAQLKAKVAWWNSVLYKCIIPKGTEYVTGICPDVFKNSKGYASRKIRVIKKQQ